MFDAHSSIKDTLPLALHESVAYALMRAASTIVSTHGKHECSVTIALAVESV